MTNPRYANGALRRKHRARLKAMGAPCGICGGRLGPIHYDEPSDAAHPLSFVVDEIRPVARGLRLKIGTTYSPRITGATRRKAASFRPQNPILRSTPAHKGLLQTAAGEGWGGTPTPAGGRPQAVQRRFTPAKNNLMGVVSKQEGEAKSGSRYF